MEQPAIHYEDRNNDVNVFEDRICIKRKGLSNLVVFGLAGVKTIPFTSISAIQLQKASTLMSGYIQFVILGENERSVGVFNAIDDENSILFAKKDNDTFARIKDYIEGKILASKKMQSQSQSQSQAQVNPANRFSAADEILKYKKLLDNKVITQEEFDAKKKQLLEKDM